jgi:hypothetical protein
MKTNTETTGGTRFSQGKPGGWWFMPLRGLRLVSAVSEHGAKKYAPRDWAEGQSFSTLLDCAARHMIEVLDRGPWARNKADGDVYHVAQVVWNLLCLLTFMEQERHDLDDVTPWFGVSTEEKERLENEERSTTLSTTSI